MAIFIQCFPHRKSCRDAKTSRQVETCGSTDNDNDDRICKGAIVKRPIPHAKNVGVTMIRNKKGLFGLGAKSSKPPCVNTCDAIAAVVPSQLASQRGYEGRMEASRALPSVCRIGLDENGLDWIAAAFALLTARKSKHCECQRALPTCSYVLHCECSQS